MGLKRLIAVTPPAVVFATCAVASAAAPAPSTGGCPLPAFGPGATYRPQITPSDFSANVDNPWFPLPPGRALVYTGVKDRKPALDLVFPSTRTRVIDGVTTRVVEDRLYLGNRLAERTSDYYAQDRCGNVWYFGEDTAELDRHGKVTSREGSFHAGERSAQPGVFMQAEPALGLRFRQEWSPGQAEDTFRTIALSASATVPYGRFSGALRTAETTALEPRVLDNKLYARGIGELEERAVKGPRELLRLVEIVR